MVAAGGLDHCNHDISIAVGPVMAAKLPQVFDTCVSNRERTLGCWVLALVLAGYVAGCLHVVGHCFLVVCIPVVVACTLFVACRASSTSSVPTGEAAFAVHTASVLVDIAFGFVVACDCLRLFVVVMVVGVVIAVVVSCVRMVDNARR